MDISAMPELPLPAEVGEQFEKRCKDLGIKYLLPALSSFSVGVHAPVVPVSAAKRLACIGSTIHGMIDFGYGGEQAECYAVPDLSTLIQLPWKPEFGWLSCKLLDCLDQLGWGPYQIEKEAAIGQYEINFGYTDALSSADRMLFFKFMVKDIARDLGLRVTFMPYLPGSSGGNGQHMHHSLWDVETGQNVMKGDGELGLSEVGRYWLAGVVNHVNYLTAIACPTTNSYKRLHMVKNFMNFNGYGVKNRYCPLRIVKARGTSERIEYRQPDGATNPYLIHAALIATGIDGLNKKEEPNPLLRSEECLWGESTPKHCTMMPKTLEKAIIALKSDPVITAALGEESIKGFEAVKDMECEAFYREVTAAEKNLLEMY